jgi:hypothetical protein
MEAHIVPGKHEAARGPDPGRALSARDSSSVSRPTVESNGPAQQSPAAQTC